MMKRSTQCQRTQTTNLNPKPKPQTPKPQTLSPKPQTLNREEYHIAWDDGEKSNTKKSASLVALPLSLIPHTAAAVAHKKRKYVWAPWQLVCMWCMCVCVCVCVMCV